MDDDIYKNDLLDCIYLAWDMDYKDVMEQLVEEWKNSVKEWNDSNRTTLIEFNTFLNKKSENEMLYQEKIASAMQTGKTFDIVSAYKDIIHHYVEEQKYDKAYSYLQKLFQNANLDEIRNIRLFTYVLEDSLEIISNYPVIAGELWNWAKINLQQQKSMFGNLYTKGIAAAKCVNDPYAAELENAYNAWKKEVGLER